MELGQGFNSYTQSLCIEDAVSYKKLVESRPLTRTANFASCFVDRPSALIAALNLSAASSIKSDSLISGSSLNSPCDIDQARFLSQQMHLHLHSLIHIQVTESDITFVIRVRVITQTTKLSEVQFTAVESITESDFPRIYGDTFISGYLVGGELVGVINMKVPDETKISEIKTHLQSIFGAAQAGENLGTLSGIPSEGIRSVVSVSWTGGGQLQDSESPCQALNRGCLKRTNQHLTDATPWGIDSLFRIASRFPKLCAQNPQRCSAILTKYDTLASFHNSAAGKFTVATYEHAGLYTADLFDDYMRYKDLQKQTHRMCLDISQYVASDVDGSYPATAIGLDNARREIRKQMSIITREVDAVRTNPQTASDTISNDDTIYTSPSVFATRLPTKVPATLPNPTVQPEPAPTPRLDDPKAWQWVRVAGKKSGGNNLFQHDSGRVTPEEMMLEVYRWEAKNPGRIVRGFDLEGRAKSKVLQYKKLVSCTSDKDLFVRVLYDDRWKFFAGMDSPGHDINLRGDQGCEVDIVETLMDCSGRNDVAAFNSYGSLKDNVELPLGPWVEVTGKPHMGVWVRSTLFKL